MTYKVTAAQQAAIDKLMARAKEVLRLFPDALTVDGSAFGSVDGFEAFEDVYIRLSNGAPWAADFRGAGEVTTSQKIKEKQAWTRNNRKSALQCGAVSTA